MESVLTGAIGDIILVVPAGVIIAIVYLGTKLVERKP